MDQCRELHVIEWDNIGRGGRLSDSLGNQRELAIPLGNDTCLLDKTG